MAWLQIDQTIRDHHKILDAADALETSDAHVTGCLVLLWLWAIDNAPDGSLAGISEATIARAAKWNGDKAAFIEVLTDVGLLERTPDGLMIHDWQERAGNLIERRRSDADRKRRERAEKKARESLKASDGRPTDVHTQSRVEKSKEEKSIVDGEVSPEPPQTDGGGSGNLQDQRFDQFWEAYPKKVGKVDARKAWKKAKITGEIFDKIMTAIKDAKASEQWQRENGRFIPNPSTWINQGRWDDELPELITSTVQAREKSYIKGFKTDDKPNTLGVLARMYKEEDASFSSAFNL